MLNTIIIAIVVLLGGVSLDRLSAVEGNAEVGAVGGPLDGVDAGAAAAAVGGDLPARGRRR